MIRSMTGFGRGEANGPAGRITVECRAVNHRFCEVSFRMPRQLARLEEQARKLVQQGIARGRVEVHVTWENAGTQARRIQVDKELAVAYHSALKELAEAIGSKIELTSETLAKLPDVLRIEDVEVPEAVLWETFSAALSAAVEALVAMREREGAALALDVLARAEHLAAFAAGVAARGPQVVQEHRERLSRRLEELLGQALSDPNRVLQEVAIMADRMDVTEEVQRLQSHLGQLRQTVQGADDAVGRKLDFLLQELGREVNTIGSKSSDVVITSAVVEAKAELEKIREQVQNFE